MFAWVDHARLGWEGLVRLRLFCWSSLQLKAAPEALMASPLSKTSSRSVCTCRAQRRCGAVRCGAVQLLLVGHRHPKKIRLRTHVNVMAANAESKHSTNKKALHMLVLGPPGMRARLFFFLRNELSLSGNTASTRRRTLIKP